MIKLGIYNLKEEFFPLLKISINSYNTRREDLLFWLYEFFDYELLNTKPIKIHIKEVYGEYKPLPRKRYDLKQREELIQQKKKDYKDYTVHSLTPEYQLNSYSNVARNAMKEFGYEKYGHKYTPGVVRRFVKPVMDEVGERTEELYWANYYTYEALTDEQKEKWLYILEKNKISEKEAANAFYRQEQGEDITEEKNRYKESLDEVKMLLNILPIKVPKWRLV